MILVVSDVHLGYKKCNKEEFSEFLDRYQPEEVDHLVLLGDIFDLWRRKNSEIVIEHDEILGKLCKFNANKVHYIAGNHDYYMLKLNERYGNYPFSVTKSLRLRS
jgi:UDP-2,3-diacylglucosamine pyrophosphatase LpxH